MSDATDPRAVTAALQKRYPSAAVRLEEEKQGVSIRFNPPPAASVVPGGDGTGATAGTLRAGTLRTALAADLECVMAHPSNREFKVALSGWRDAVLAEWAEGLDAAVLGADPTRLDRAFYSVRKLGDSARVARGVFGLAANDGPAVLTSSDGATKAGTRPGAHERLTVSSSTTWSIFTSGARSTARDGEGLY